jgi:hypothetical protein
MSKIESFDKTATRPVTATLTQNSLSRIAARTLGQRHGPITRLMSPSDLGHLLKPFVFLDLVDNHGKPFSGCGLHPHSGVATLTYIAEVASGMKTRTERRDLPGVGRRSCFSGPG